MDFNTPDVRRASLLKVMETEGPQHKTSDCVHDGCSLEQFVQEWVQWRSTTTSQELTLTRRRVLGKMTELHNMKKGGPLRGNAGSLRGEAHVEQAGKLKAGGVVCHGIGHPLRIPLREGQEDVVCFAPGGG